MYTLPVTRTLSNGRSSGDELRDILGKPLEPVERDKALAIVRSDDGIQSAIATGEVYAERACRALDGFDDSPVVEALRAAPSALLRTRSPRQRAIGELLVPGRTSPTQSRRSLSVRGHGADRDADAVGELGRARVPAPQRVAADADQRAGERRPRRGRRAGDASRQRRAAQHAIDQPADFEIRAVALVDQLRVALQRQPPEPVRSASSSTPPASTPVSTAYSMPAPENGLATPAASPTTR